MGPNKVFMVAQVKFKTADNSVGRNLFFVFSGPSSAGVGSGDQWVPPDWMQEMPYFRGLKDGDSIVVTVLKARDVA